MMNFECIWPHDGETDRWNGRIISIEGHGSHYEIHIQSRSSLRVIIGQSTAGGFACLPDYRIACHLAHLKDCFWNTEQLISVLGEVDGITVARALYCIADEVSI